MGSDKKKKKRKGNIEHNQEQLNNCEDLNDETETVVSEESIINHKRVYSGSDSEHSNEPKKKKKKKKTHQVETSDKKNKKSIRQIKREKFAQRQADIQAAAKEHTKSECLQYLVQWKNNRKCWKFMKAKQVWLYKNKFSESMVPNDYWSILLDYFESAKGNIRNMLLTDANKIIQQMDNWVDSQNKEENEERKQEDEDVEDTEESNKPSDKIYKRARELIQFLQE